MSESSRQKNTGSQGLLCPMAWAEFFPFRHWLFSMSRHILKADILAGLTGAVVVLPQGIAFATIAGLPPQYGLYSAMVPVIVAALTFCLNDQPMDSLARYLTCIGSAQIRQTSFAKKKKMPVEIIRTSCWPPVMAIIVFNFNWLTI